MFHFRKFSRWSGLISIVAAFTFLSSAQGDAQTAPRSDRASLEVSFRQDIAQLIALREGEGKNYASFKETAEKLLRKWGEKSEPNYFDLLFEVSSMLASTDFGFDNRQESTSLSHYYAFLALAKKDRLSVGQEAGFAARLSDDVKPAGNVEAWATQREKKARAMLQAWQRIQAGIKADHNFDEELVLSVSPPPGVKGLSFSGMSPANIKDPKLRAEYEAAIWENQRKTEERNTQRELQDLTLFLGPTMENYLVSAYSQSPFNVRELKELMDASVKDEKVKSAILSSVIAKMKATVAGVEQDPHHVNNSNK